MALGKVTEVPDSVYSPVQWCDTNIVERENTSHLELRRDPGARTPRCLDSVQFSVLAPLPPVPRPPSPRPHTPVTSHLCFRMASSLVYLYRPERAQEEG